MAKNKVGRPKITLTKKQKDLAIQYVKTSGLYKIRLAKYLRISRKSLYRLLKRDEDFDTDLQRADSEFCADLIKRANPTKILEAKYRDEFHTKKEIELSADRRMEAFLDKQDKRLSG